MDKATDPEGKLKLAIILCPLKSNNADFLRDLGQHSVKLGDVRGKLRKGSFILILRVCLCAMKNTK